MHDAKIPVALTIAFLMGVAGCGNRGDDLQAVPTGSSQSGYGTVAPDPYASAQYPTPGEAPASASSTPRPVPTVPVSPLPGDDPVASPSPSSAPTATPAPTPTPIPVDFRLRINDVKKSTSGILLWKKAEITVQVQNPLLTRARSGQVVVTFFLGGEIIGQPLTTGITLAPGEIKSFTFKATSHSDDSNAQVTTDGQ